MPHDSLRTPRITGLPVLLLALALAGCAGKVQTTHERSGFGRDDLARDRLGVGGVVLGARLAGDPGALPAHDVPLNDVLAQAEAWTPLLYGQLLARADGVVIWPWPSVRDACGDSLLVGALAATARASVLKPAQLAPLADALGEIRYLAFARVDGDELTLHEAGPGTAENPQVRDNRDPHAVRRAPTLKVRRQVKVTMDVYDLVEGRSVWTTSAERHRDELYDFNADDSGREPRVMAEGEPVITAEGRSLPAPPFAKILEDACGALAERLLQKPGP